MQSISAVESLDTSQNECVYTSEKVSDFKKYKNFILTSVCPPSKRKEK